MQNKIKLTDDQIDAIINLITDKWSPNDDIIEVTYEDDNYTIGCEVEIETIWHDEDDYYSGTGARVYTWANCSVIDLYAIDDDGHILGVDVEVEKEIERGIVNYIKLL